MVLAHLKYLTDQALARGDAQAARLANNMGYYLDTIADYPGAKPYYEQALAIMEKKLGVDHPITKIVRGNLNALIKKMKGKG